MTILIVDDEPLLREMIARYLKHAGHLAIEADCAEAALAVPKDYDLVVTDLKMPGMGGWGLIRELRADPVTAQVPVVVITAETDRAAMQRAVEVGASVVLEKPFSIHQLRAAVSSFPTPRGRGASDEGGVARQASDPTVQGI